MCGRDPCSVVAAVTEVPAVCQIVIVGIRASAGVELTAESAAVCGELGGRCLVGWFFDLARSEESITVRVTAALVVAVRPAAVPVATASFESPRTPLTFPVPVAAALVRAVVSDGNVQVRGSVDDFSVQIETSQLFSFSTATVGAVWLEVDVVPAPTSDATTVAWAVLRYAATPITDLAKALVVTVTFAPASPAAAVLVQARPRIPVPSRLSSSVQPDTVSLIVLVVELVVK